MTNTTQKRSPKRRGLKFKKREPLPAPASSTRTDVKPESDDHDLCEIVCDESGAEKPPEVKKTGMQPARRIIMNKRKKRVEGASMKASRETPLPGRSPFLNFHEDDVVDKAKADAMQLARMELKRQNRVAKSTSKAVSEEQSSDVIDEENALAREVGLKSWKAHQRVLSQLMASAVHPDSRVLDDAWQEFESVVDLLGSFEPRDVIEVMLARNIVAASEKHMHHLRLSNDMSLSFEELKFHSKIALDYMKLLPKQVEAFDKHRSRQLPKMPRQNVNVSDGGQAFVANVTTSPRGESGRSEGEGEE